MKITVSDYDGKLWQDSRHINQHGITGESRVTSDYRSRVMKPEKVVVNVYWLLQAHSLYLHKKIKFVILISSPALRKSVAHVTVFTIQHKI
jgi:hypothetical protein